MCENPANADLRRLKKVFKLEISAGEICKARQTGTTDTCPKPTVLGNKGPGLWTLEVPIDRAWTNARQPSQCLRDPLMDEIDELLP